MDIIAVGGDRMTRSRGPRHVTLVVCLLLPVLGHASEGAVDRRGGGLTGVEIDAAPTRRLAAGKSPERRAAPGLVPAAPSHDAAEATRPGGGAVQLAILDWIVIAAYGIALLIIGRFYSRRNRTTEDYLLGGRTMRPWTVGLSLFATLLSTLTYLAYPGEIIQHGPMFLTEVFAFPIVFLVVGWLVIPFIMRLRVTTAYEILERRFGLSVRMLGASLFVTLRLLWMAAILYATVDNVLVPLTGLDGSTTLWISFVLGVITIVYTSMGGLRAVVVTDVVQASILLGGAILTLFMITHSLGGVGAWWPAEYAPHWQEPKFGFQTDARVTAGWAILTSVTWYVCTTSSDQMAIQRFLSTRDVRAARGVLLTTLVSIAVVMLFLSLVGLALIGYFTANPHLLAEGTAITTNGDLLFPRFIVLGLPGGITGLIVVGLLAAAMSSLSSGINSVASVIAIDFIERFRRTPQADAGRARLVVGVSWITGLAAIGLSFFVSVVPGNLFEVVNRVVNLLVAPLSILFFMAMFVPWATSLGTWLGAAVSIATAVLIAYWAMIFGTPGPSFLWIMPVSLLTGAVAGPLFSLLPSRQPATAIRDIVQPNVRCAERPGMSEGDPPR